MTVKVNERIVLNCYRLGQNNVLHQYDNCVIACVCKCACKVGSASELAETGLAVIEDDSVVNSFGILQSDIELEADAATVLSFCDVDHRSVKSELAHSSLNSGLNHYVCLAAIYCLIVISSNSSVVYVYKISYCLESIVEYLFVLGQVNVLACLCDGVFKSLNGEVTIHDNGLDQRELIFKAFLELKILRIADLCHIDNQHCCQVVRIYRVGSVELDVVYAVSQLKGYISLSLSKSVAQISNGFCSNTVLHCNVEGILCTVKCKSGSNQLAADTAGNGDHGSHCTESSIVLNVAVCVDNSAETFEAESAPCKHINDSLNVDSVVISQRSACESNGVVLSKSRYKLHSHLRCLNACKIGSNTKHQTDVAACVLNGNKECLHIAGCKCIVKVSYELIKAFLAEVNSLAGNNQLTGIIIECGKVLKSIFECSIGYGNLFTGYVILISAVLDVASRECDFVVSTVCKSLSAQRACFTFNNNSICIRTVCNNYGFSNVRNINSYFGECTGSGIVIKINFSISLQFYQQAFKNLDIIIIENAVKSKAISLITGMCNIPLTVQHINSDSNGFLVGSRCSRNCSEYKRLVNSMIRSLTYSCQDSISECGEICALAVDIFVHTNVGKVYTVKIFFDFINLLNIYLVLLHLFDLINNRIVYYILENFAKCIELRSNIFTIVTRVVISKSVFLVLLHVLAQIESISTGIYALIEKGFNGRFSLISPTENLDSRNIFSRCF